MCCNLPVGKTTAKNRKKLIEENNDFSEKFLPFFQIFIFLSYAKIDSELRNFLYDFHFQTFLFILHHEMMIEREDYKILVCPLQRFADSKINLCRRNSRKIYASSPDVINAITLWNFALWVVDDVIIIVMNLAERHTVWTILRVRTVFIGLKDRKTRFLEQFSDH